MTLLTKLKETKKMKVIHGEILSSGMTIKERKHDPHDLNRFDPVLVLVEYMRIDNLRLIDFFQYLDTTNREQLSRTDFRDGVAVNFPQFVYFFLCSIGVFSLSSMGALLCSILICLCTSNWSLFCVYVAFLPLCGVVWFAI